MNFWRVSQDSYIGLAYVTVLRTVFGNLHFEMKYEASSKKAARRTGRTTSGFFVYSTK